MHELAIVEGVIDAVTERLPGTQVTAVRLQVGELSGVVEDSLLFCFDLATHGTTLEGASLEVDRVPDSQELKIASVKVVA